PGSSPSDHSSARPGVGLTLRRCGSAVAGAVRPGSGLLWLGSSCCGTTIGLPSEKERNWCGLRWLGWAAEVGGWDRRLLRSRAPLPVAGKNGETRLRAGIRACRRGASALTARLVVLQRAERRMVLAARLQPVINVETLHPVEIKHAYEVFSFRRMQSFHDK